MASELLASRQRREAYWDAAIMFDPSHYNLNSHICRRLLEEASAAEELN